MTPMERKQLYQIRCQCGALLLKGGGVFNGKFFMETKCDRCKNIVAAEIEKGKGKDLIIRWCSEIN